MFRKTLVALVASLALGAGIAPGVAAPRMMSGGGHGFAGHGGPGFHGGPAFHAGPGWRSGPGWRQAPGRSYGAFAFIPGFFGYGYGPYAYGYGPYGYGPDTSCWQPRRVLTASGWHWREAWVCG